jgi:DNA polymerase III alpha subunit
VAQGSTQAPSTRTLFMGVDQVRDLTQRTIERIIRFRPYPTLDDFLTRVDPRPQEADSLARVGALEGLGTIPAILKRLENKDWLAGQPSLFGGSIQEAGEPDWTVEKKVAAQIDLLGISLEAHPLELVAGRVREAGAISTLDAAGRVGQRVKVAGVRQSSHRNRTAKGDMMMFLSLEDLSGMLDVVVFPDVYRQAKLALNGASPILVQGIMEMDPGRSEPLLRAEKVMRLA